MPRTLRFNAPAHHVLIEEGKEIPGGETFTVSEKRAEELLTAPYADVRDVADEPGPDDGLARLKRPQLDELARQAGIDPAELRNKDAVIAALREQKPTAEGGEGQDNPEKED